MDEPLDPITPGSPEPVPQVEFNGASVAVNLIAAVVLALLGGAIAYAASDWPPLLIGLCGIFGTFYFTSHAIRASGVPGPLAAVLTIVGGPAIFVGTWWIYMFLTSGGIEP